MIALALASTTAPPANPLLAKWLQRARPSAATLEWPARGQAALLANAADLAVGARYWLKLTPIKLRADGLSLRLVDADVALDDAQQNTLSALLPPLVAAAGFELHRTTRGDWLLACDTVFDHIGAPPTELLGADVHAHLPKGSANRPLRTMLSEIEITLAAHAASVNGAWLSAGGCLADAPRCAAKLLISDDPVWQAWADHNGSKTVPLRQAGMHVGTDTLVDLRTPAAIASLNGDFLLALRTALRWGRAGPLLMGAQHEPTLAMTALRAWH